MPKRIREVIKNKGGHIDYFMNHQYGLDTGNSFAVEKNSVKIFSVQINLHGTVVPSFHINVIILHYLLYPPRKNPSPKSDSGSK